MYAHCQSIALIAIVLLLLAGCRSTATPSSASPLPTAAPAAALPSPTATPMPPTQTPAPSTWRPDIPQWTGQTEPTPATPSADGEGLRITILYDNYLYDERLTSECCPLSRPVSGIRLPRSPTW